MRGDRKLLFALFSNLLSNALKYSAPGDPVDVAAYSDAGARIAVRMRDRGIGIPERDRAHLFERYFRGANAVGVAGSGVGLHLVSMVLELHGGTIEVDSCEGAGSTFVVHLPTAAAAGIHPTQLNLGAA
jgi:signal transduction histidine kinase